MNGRRSRESRTNIALPPFASNILCKARQGKARFNAIKNEEREKKKRKQQ